MQFPWHFIHLATEEQIPHVLGKFWQGKEYVIVKLDAAKLGGRMELESSFYHLHDVSSIPKEAVIGRK